MGIPILLGILSFGVLVLYQTHGIYPGDGGDLVTAAYLFGVPHPPGYPLYTALGWLLTRLPFATAVWRMTLLSSVPHAVTVSMVWLIIRSLTNNSIAALFGALVLLGNYLFFLLGTTPEVFALFDLFVVLILYAVYRVQTTRPATWVLVLIGTISLSLTHHHLILFLVPALVYVWISRGMSARLAAVPVWKTMLFAAIPLTIYAYLPIAGSRLAIIDWDSPHTLEGFIRLLTRQDYGTFISSGAFGSSLKERAYSIVAFGQLLWFDFRLPGVLMAGFGAAWVWRRARNYAVFLFLAVVFLGPGFFFYASFPLLGRFALGTFERFLLPTYLIVSVFAGVGLHSLWEFFHIALYKRLGAKRTQAYANGLLFVLFLYPFIMLSMTLWRFWGLSADRTTEHLAGDILASAPPDAIIFLAADTPLFATQFGRYVLAIRPDTVVIHASRLASSDYHEILRKNFPDLEYPSSTASAYLREFVEKNIGSRPIMANAPFPINTDIYWVPHGLLLRAFPQSQLPVPDELAARNEPLWEQFRNPHNGLLSRYPHLMLTDVLDSYSKAKMDYGNAFFRAGNMEKAKSEFQKAIEFGGDAYLGDAHLMLGITRMFLQECAGAIEQFEKAGEYITSDKKMVALARSVTYRDCVGDPLRAREVFEEYEALVRESEQPLDRL